MTRIRACILCNEYPPAPHGGIGSVSRDLAEGLAARGHDITVVGIALRWPNTRITDDIVNGVRVVRVPRAPMWLPSPIRDRWHRWRFRAVVERLHRVKPFELLESPDYQGWASHGPLRGAPLLVRINGTNFFFDTELRRAPHVFEQKHEFRCIRAATHLAASSRYAAKRHLEIAGIADRPCEVIPNCVDASIFCPDVAIEPEPGLILYVNSLNPKKGIEQLIDAANLLLPQRPGARLVVVGGDNMRAMQGRYLEQLKERVAASVRERVVFAGRLQRDEVRDWIRRAAVCVYPSHMETFGIAPAEAMACARPTVFSGIGPGPELVEDGVNGLLCDPFSPADIARAITEILDAPTRATALGAAAREKILGFCDTRHWLATNEAFYRHCVGAGTNHPASNFRS